MNNFWTRTLTGALFVAVMIFCIWWNYWSMVALFLVISVLGLWEFYSLLEKANYHPQKILGIIFGTIIFPLMFIDGDFNPVNSLFFIPFLWTLFIAELFNKKDTPITNIALTLFGIGYIVFPFLLLVIQSLNYSNNLLLAFFFLIWANDTFAYLVGRAIGKTKLFERISPKKTWEGTIGGAVFTQGVAYLISVYFTELPPVHWHAIALIVSVFGTLGDLVESMFKRSLGVKDSGNILPGHGGILDRFDGVLLSAPFVVTYLLVIR